jgi:hypothetical protein
MFPTETLLPWIDMDESQAYIARHECSFVQSGKKFYMFGGRESPEKLDIFDYTHNTWTQGAMAPKPFNHFQAVSYEGLIWVIGGFQTSNNFPDEEPQENVYVYDPANDMWMEGPEIPWPRGAGGLVVYMGRFYLVGGNARGHDGGFVTWMDEYNPVTGEWDIMEDATHERDHFHAAVLGDKLYAVGGRRTIRGNTQGDTVKEVDVYDFATKQWLITDLPMDIPLPRAAAAVAAFAGKIMVIGGETARSRVAHDRVDALDPTNGRWSALTPLNHRRHGIQAIVSGEGVYVAGGSPNRGGGHQRRMEVYNRDAPEGGESRPGLLGVYFGRGGLVTLQHIGGNQGVFLNSIVLTGPDASDFRIMNQATSRILIRKNGKLTLSVEYKGDAEEAAAQMIVTYSGKKTLNISVPANSR